MELNSSSDLFTSSNSINRLSRGGGGGGGCFTSRLERRLAAGLTATSLLSLSLFIALIVIVCQRRSEPASNVTPDAGDQEICRSASCVAIAKDMHSFIDSSVDACHDMYEHTCGQWIKDYELPDTGLEDGPIALTQQSINQRIRGQISVLDTKTRTQMLAFH